MQRGSYTVFLAFDAGGDAVGLISLGECGAVYAGGRFGVIHELYVDPAVRSCGIGTALLERAKRESVERRWGRLEVGAPHQPKWRKTAVFYQREGFQVIGPRLRWMPDGHDHAVTRPRDAPKAP
ncbi:MAG: GNAT family N-acetyltransferase [Spirochaetaceae bacterium]|nr:MAG: GNAT family N-acetyltransferase [Spirochaetaceae bacterium]